jgi:hypothetical protein
MKKNIRVVLIGALNLLGLAEDTFSAPTRRAGESRDRSRQPDRHTYAYNLPPVHQAPAPGPTDEQLEKARLEKEEKEQLMHEAEGLRPILTRIQDQSDYMDKKVREEAQQVEAVWKHLRELDPEQSTALNILNRNEEKTSVKDDLIPSETRKGRNEENQKIIDDIQYMKREFKRHTTELDYLENKSAKLSDINQALQNKLQFLQLTAELRNLATSPTSDSLDEDSELTSNFPRGGADHDTLSVISFGSEHSNLTAIQTEIMKNPTDSHEDLSRSRSSSQLSRRTDKDDQELV